MCYWPADRIPDCQTSDARRAPWQPKSSGQVCFFFLPPASIATLDLLMKPLCRYFNRGKLDYPNTDTTRASRKYVRAMKQLSVRARLSDHAFQMSVPLLTITLPGIHPNQYQFPPVVSGPFAADLCLRPEEPHHGQASITTSLV